MESEEGEDVVLVAGFKRDISVNMCVACCPFVSHLHSCVHPVLAHRCFDHVTIVSSSRMWLSIFVEPRCACLVH
jgi:hypothetical protein